MESSPVPRRADERGGLDLLDQRVAYGPLLAACHWTIAVLCIVEFPTANAIRKAHMGHVFGVRGSAFDQFMAWSHEWGGWLILALALPLAFNRLRRRGPRLPEGMTTWQRWFANGAHFAIYAGLFSLVASGAAAMYSGGTLAALHVGLSKVGIALIGLHVAAVGWHQFIRRDGLLWRMWPRS